MVYYRDISLMESVPLLWHFPPVLNKSGAAFSFPTTLPFVRFCLLSSLWRLQIIQLHNTSEYVYTYSLSGQPSSSWHVDFEMCFAPQRRALFRHPNFQKCSGRVVFFIFWLGNVLRATMACTFTTSQLPKVFRTCGVFNILTWKCASRHNGVHFFDISTSKRGPPEPQIIGNKTMFRGFPTFLCTCFFFLLTLSLLWSSLFCSSLLYASAPPLLFICPYCRKFDF